MVINSEHELKELGKLVMNAHAVLYDKDSNADDKDKAVFKDMLAKYNPVYKEDAIEVYFDMTIQGVDEYTRFNSYEVYKGIKSMCPNLVPMVRSDSILAIHYVTANYSSDLVREVVLGQMSSVFTYLKDVMSKNTPVYHKEI